MRKNQNKLGLYNEKGMCMICGGRGYYFSTNVGKKDCPQCKKTDKKENKNEE